MEQLSPNSRVWIYQSKTEIPATHIPVIESHLKTFVQKWTSHNKALKAHAELRNGRFIILMVDESQAGASGCSIDSSVHFLQVLEREYELDLFDRMTFTYEQDGEVYAAERNEFAQLYEKGLINDDTLVFDNLVTTKADLETKWKVRLSDSWHKQMVA